MEKKHYFSLTNRKEKIENWLTISRESKSYFPFTLNLDNAALLVLDMQNYFLDRNSHAHIPSAGTIIPTIQKLIAFMKENSRPIIFTKHISSDKSDDLMLRWWKDNITHENELSEITPFIEADKGITINKSKYSAFSSPQFTKLIRESSVKQLIITGVMTHLCCETTARDAFMNGFEVFFVVDGTATYNEELHEGTIRAISHGFGVCLSSEEILNAK